MTPADRIHSALGSEDHPAGIPERFDPFVCRSCRDLRNRLSGALMRTLLSGDEAPWRSAAAGWQAHLAQKVHRDYLGDRTRRYARLMPVPPRGSSASDWQVAAELWNAGLFFELHEWLESLWRQADGSQKALLKGLVQAAGVYVLGEAGRCRAAAALAAKARSRLDRRDRSPADLPLKGMLASLDLRPGPSLSAGRAASDGTIMRPWCAPAPCPVPK
jgi:hypothetical protein